MSTTINNTHKVRIVAFSGSLRASSANGGLVRAASAIIASSFPEVELVDITHLVGQLPHYDADLETEKGFHGAIREWREALRSADALLIATPEYNYSVPGVLKNALDWASRPDDATFTSFPTYDKPVAIMGAGGGMGTSRAQYHLRQIGVHLNWHMINRPEVNVNLWGGKQIADASTGDIIDEGTKEKVKGLIGSLVAFTKRLNAERFGASGASALASQRPDEEKKKLSDWTKEELKAALKEKKKQARLESSEDRPQ